MPPRRSNPAAAPTHIWSRLNVSLRDGAARTAIPPRTSLSASPTGHFLLWLFTAGRGQVRLLGRTIDVDGETAVLLPAGVPARVRADAKRAMEVIQIPFDCLWDSRPVRDARPIVDPDRMSFTIQGHVELSLYGTMGTLNIGQQILRARAKRPVDLGELEAAIQITRCLFMMRQALDQAGRGIPSPKPPMRRAYVQLLARVEQPALRMDDIARHVGMSTRQLLRAFRTEYGASPIRILTRERMALARRLLLTPEFRIGEVAAACGYASPGYFCRVFKAENGMSAGNYRKRHAADA